MKTNAKITLAWCVELKSVMTIVEARAEYFGSPLPRGYFNFLCSSPECRALEVPPKITAVNYYIFPDDEALHQVMHFRANSHYEHDPSCEWIEEDGSNGEELGAIDEDEKVRRRARAKLHHFVDVFDPSRDSDADGEVDVPESSGAAGPTTGNSGRHRRRSGGSVLRKTGSLERLVEFYQEARRELPDAAFRALKIQTPDRGHIALRSYFAPVKFAKPGKNLRVLNGNARFRQYGRGFLLTFFDKVDEKKVSLYVSSEKMLAYRQRRYLEEVLKQSDRVKWFRAYVRGSLVLKEHEGSQEYSLEVDDLRDLVLVLGAPII
jgi:hypothetical protein